MSDEMNKNKKNKDISVDSIIKEVMKKKKSENQNGRLPEESKNLGGNNVRAFSGNGVKEQLNYTKTALLNDNKSEKSIEDMFVNAARASGKKLTPAQKHAIEESKLEKQKNHIDLPLLKQAEIDSRAAQKTELVTKSSYDDFGWRTDGIPLSDLVAGAMQAKKNNAAINNNVYQNDGLSGAVVSDVKDKEETSKKRVKWSTKKKASVILCYILGVVFLLCGCGVSVFTYFTGKLNRPANTSVEIYDPGQSDIGESDTINAVDYEELLRQKLEKSAANILSDKDVTNILLVGEDIRDTTNESRGNTDVMMVISINSARETVTMSSFMRDTYLQIPNYYATRLNAAYSMGGMDLLKQTIQDNFSIQIDRYALVNFRSFIDIVDTIGGLEITITDAEAEGMKAPMGEQNKILGNKQGTDYLKKGGTYVMNGNQALAYSRLRYVDNGDKVGDWGRTLRQRTVIDLIAKKSSDLSLMDLKSLLDKVLPEVTTDLTDSEIAYYLLNSSKILGYERQQLQIPADGTFSNETIRGMSVIVPDFDSNIAVLQETIYGYSNVLTTQSSDYSVYSDASSGDYSGGYSGGQTAGNGYNTFD